MRVKPKGTKIPGWFCYTVGWFNGKFGQYAIVDGYYKSRLTGKILANLDSYLAEEVTLLSNRTKKNIQTAKTLVDRRLELKGQPKSTDLIENFRTDDEISQINKQISVLHSEHDTEVTTSKESMLEGSVKYEYLLSAYYSGLSKSGFDLNSCQHRVNVSDESERNKALEIYNSNLGKYWNEIEKYITAEE